MHTYCGQIAMRCLGALPFDEEKGSSMNGELIRVYGTFELIKRPEEQHCRDIQLRTVRRYVGEESR